MRMKKYNDLAQPFYINGMEVRNKFFMAPMAIPLTGPHREYTDQAVEYYAQRAKGGIGLIITGANFVDNEIEKHADYTFASPRTNPHIYIKKAREMTDRVHNYNSKIFCQLTAGLGRSALPTFLEPGADFVAPSPIKNRWTDMIDHRELTTEEVEQIVKDFAESAVICKQAGFDGVEIHAVHEGYLLDCFTMEFFNQRTDKYGGSLENRLRFPIEIVQAIKSVCGQDFPVILRFSIKSYLKGLRQGGVPGEEFEEKGRSLEEGLVVAKMLEEAGYDAFDADAGTYDSWYWAHPPLYHEKGMYLELASKLQEVVSVPVMVAGRMDEPEMMLKAYQDGIVDAIGLGRPVLADTDYVNKLLTENEDDIRPCLGCHAGCFVRMVEGGTGSCAVNPECNRETLVRIEPAFGKKKIVCVGGGPACLEAARVSAIRGYDVTLFEANEKVGGELLIGGQPSFKIDDLRLAAWYEKQMQDLGVDVRCNTIATKEMVDQLDPDIVYISEGSRPIELNIPGAELASVSYANEVLKGEVEVGDKIVVIGGGLVASELALDLAQKGKDVAIVEIKEDILKGGIPLFPANDWMLRDLLAFNNVEILTKSTAVEVTENGLVIDHDGEKIERTADNVIVAIGYRSVNDLYKELREDYPLVYNLGDGKRVGGIMDAIWDGYEVSRQL